MMTLEELRNSTINSAVAREAYVSGHRGVSKMFSTPKRHLADGPWITFYGNDREATFNLRDWVRRQISAADNTLRRRTLREWLQAREAEGNKETITPPADETRKPLPLARRTRERSTKR